MAEPTAHHWDADVQASRPSGNRGSAALLVRTVPVADPGNAFLDQIPVPAAFSWVRQAAGLIGWGEAARIALPAAADRFTTAEKWLREVTDSADIDDAVRRRGSGLVAFGSFTFDDCSDGSVMSVPSLRPN